MLRGSADQRADSRANMAAERSYTVTKCPVETQTSAGAGTGARGPKRILHVRTMTAAAAAAAADDDDDDEEEDD